jgi:hypothetical protein
MATRQTKSKASTAAPAMAKRKPARGEKERARDKRARKQPAEVTPDLDMEWLREGSTAADQREVELLTNRLFASALERCGWHRNERGEIEHIDSRG